MRRWLTASLLPTIIVVHTLDNREVAISSHAIITFSVPGESFTDKANCIITLLDGKFVSTKETCRQIATLMAEAPTGGYLDGK